MKNKMMCATLAACSLAMVLGCPVGAAAQYVYPPFPTPASECPEPEPTAGVPYIRNPSFECPGIPAPPNGPPGYMSIESGPITPGFYGNSGAYSAGWMYIDGWKVGGSTPGTAGGVDYMRNAIHGNYSINYVRAPGDHGWITTTIKHLIYGRQYELSFYTNQAPLGAATALTATVDSNPPQTYINTIAGAWEQKHFLFIAQDESASLRFDSALSGTLDNALLDNVAIVEKSSSLKVAKLVQVTAPAQPPSTPVTFTVKVDCSLALNNASYPLSQTFHLTYVSGPIPPQAMNNIPTGSTCTISENPLPPTTPVPNAGCSSGYAAWGPVHYPDSNNSSAPVQSVVMGASSDTLYVRNTFACTAAPPTGVLTIKKVVINDANPNADMSGIHYPMQVQCGSSYTTNFQIPDSSNSFAHAVPTPITAPCHVVEFWHNISLPRDDKLCPAGQVLRWLAPTYSPANITGSGVITVQNTLKCVLDGPRESKCNEPMIPSSNGSACVCPQNLVQRGQTCVISAACVPPAKLNRRGECECPKDMMLKGDSCIRQIGDGPRAAPKPDASPKETIKAIPGAAAPDRGTDEGKPGRR